MSNILEMGELIRDQQTHFLKDSKNNHLKSSKIFRGIGVERIKKLSFFSFGFFLIKSFFNFNGIFDMLITQRINEIIGRKNQAILLSFN